MQKMCQFSVKVLWRLTDAGEHIIFIRVIDDIPNSYHTLQPGCKQSGSCVENMHPFLTNIIIWLVVWNMAFIFPYVGNDIPNWRTHIFQRGRYTTNKTMYYRYHDLCLRHKQRTLTINVIATPDKIDTRFITIFTQMLLFYHVLP